MARAVQWVWASAMGPEAAGFAFGEARARRYAGIRRGSGEQDPGQVRVGIVRKRSSTGRLRERERVGREERRRNGTNGAGVKSHEACTRQAPGGIESSKRSECLGHDAPDAEAGHV